MSLHRRAGSRMRSRGRAPAFELDEATVSSLQDAMAAGRYTSRRLVELYLRAHRGARPRRARRCARSSSSTRMRAAIADRSTPSGEPAGCADRCTASRS